MRILGIRLAVVAAVLSVAVMTGCATTRPTVTEALAAADTTAWAVKGAGDELTVSVSEAGRTIKLIPRVGKVAAISVDAMVNDKYRVAIREALEDYDLEEVFVSKLRDGLEQNAPHRLAQVGPLTSTVGYHTAQDAQAARLKRLGKEGVSVLMDVDVDYGVYGAEFEMRVTLAASVVSVPEGRRIWRGKVPVVIGPLLADMKSNNILEQHISGLTDPQLKVDKDAMVELTGDDAALLKGQFEECVAAAVSALLCDMGLADEALGRYYLGRRAFQDQDYEEATDHFRRAQTLGAASMDVRNDLAVTHARLGRVDEALDSAKQILNEDPEYTPALFNLAWWYAFDKEDLDTARRYYEQALAAGMAPSKKLEKVLEEPEPE